MSTKIKNLWVFDENKLLILNYLWKTKNQKDVCGRDLVDLLDIPKNLLSYHIKVLRENNYIKEEKRGKRKIYTLNKRNEDKIKEVLSVVGLL